jgi:Tfp pilus assembly protein PilX
MTPSQSVKKQCGAALVVGLIMLVLITLMLITALNVGTANFRSVSNMQFREEAIAAANQAIEQVISSTFAAAPAAETIEIDTDNDDDADYVVDIAIPVCVSATQASAPPPSSIALGPTMSLDSTWNTVWELDATVAAADDSVAAGDNVGSAAARIHAGVRVLLTGTQKDAVCS